MKRGELGILGTELNSELAKAMKVDAQRGAFVSQVMPNSSAAKAGIKAGDVITGDHIPGFNPRFCCGGVRHNLAHKRAALGVNFHRFRQLRVQLRTQNTQLTAFHLARL